MPKCEDWLKKEACGRLRLSGDRKTIRYKTDKQQGLIVQRRELYLLSCDKSQWKRLYKQLCVYV